MPVLKVKIDGVWVTVAGGEDDNTDLTGYATEDWVRQGYQPKGNYLSTSELSDAINTALDEAKDSGEFKGDPGETPVRGTHYWTESDIADIKSYIDEVILGGEW